MPAPLRALRWICDSCKAKSRPPASAFSQHARTYATRSKKARLPETPVRTRFAPSPTGNLHLGSIRTALFNYLLAKRTQGQFLLRIEDTDQNRTVPGAEERLFEDLQWAGLQWDEGPVVGGPYGPYRQSERKDIYNENIKPLIESGKAYRCFCSSERLHTVNKMRRDKGLSLGYDRQCADIPRHEADDRAHQGQAFVVRLRSENRYPSYMDMVYGLTGSNSNNARRTLIDQPVYDDPILLKSDGYPTYHFANVVDDHHMKITHVIRGTEWMASTPLHLALYEALGWVPPAFGHVGLLVDEHRKKLSKRDSDSDMASFRKQDAYPDALVNFAALLGWSHQRKSDIMDLKQLEQLFDVKFTRGETVVTFDKLRFLREQHARRRISAGGEEFEQMIRDAAVAVLEKHGARAVSEFLRQRKLRDVIALLLQADSMPHASATSFAEKCSIFISNPVPRKALSVFDESSLPSIQVAAASLCLVPEELWTAANHRSNLTLLQLPSEKVNEPKRWWKDFHHYLRWALVGGDPGPGIIETMEILGRQTCVERIQSAGREAAEQLDVTDRAIAKAGATAAA